MRNNYYKKDKEIVFRCKCHIIWTPKYRRKILTGKIKTRLEEVIEESCSQDDADIIKIDIEPSYVHLHLDYNPCVGIDKLVKHIKRISTPILRNEFPELCTKLPCLWSNSYFASTEPPSAADIQEYVISQPTSQRK